MSQRANLIRCRGLVTSGSELSVPEGSLRQASNVNIDENGVITPRRGFAEYGNATDLITSARVKQLFEYKDRLFRYFNTSLEYEDSLGQFQPISGAFNELRDGYRLKYQESKGNLYFTTSEGIKRISLKSAPNGNVTVEQAGVPKAAYMEGTAVPEIGGFLAPQSKVGYRFIFGRKDANNNLLLGSASARHVITHEDPRVVVPEVKTLTINTYNHFSNGEYIVLPTKTSKYTFYFQKSNTEALPPLTSNTFGSIFVKVNLQNASSTSDVAAILANEIISNVAEYTVELSTATKITLTSLEEGNIDPIISTVLGTDLTVSEVTNGSVTEGSQANTSLTLIIPSTINTDYFVQVYRTAPITASQGLTLDDIDPGDECNLFYETAVTTDHISAGQIVIKDTTPESFRASGTPLYSNEITGEGILQSNDPPPIALDMTLFRNSMFYANTKGSHRLEFKIISVDDYELDKTRLIIGNSSVTRIYTASNLENITPEGGDFVLSDSVSPAIQIDATSRSLVKVINQDPDSPVNAYYLTGADDLPGQLLLEARSLLDDPFYFAIESGYDAYNPLTDYYQDDDRVSINKFDYAHKTVPLFLNTPWSNLVTYNEGDIVSKNSKLWIALENVNPNLNQDPETETAFWKEYKATLNQYNVGDIVRNSGAIFKALDINSDTDTTNATNWEDLANYAPSGNNKNNDLWNYIALAEEFSPEIDQSRVIESIIGTATPSEKTVITLTNHGFSNGDQVYVSFMKLVPDPNDPFSTIPDINDPDSFFGVFTVSDSNPDLNPNIFSINLPKNELYSFSGPDTFYSAVFYPNTVSDNLEVPNRLYFSKVSEPEAVPITNYIDVGAQDEEIKRILALRDNLFILKDDGIFIVSGSSAPDFSVRLLDNVRILAPDSAVVLNNQIYALTAQGVTMITDSGAGVVSSGIDNLIDEVINSKYDWQRHTFGIAYENDRAYILFAPSASTDLSATQAFRYNIFERTWSRWEYPANCGIVTERDNRLYLGNGVRNFVTQERKDFNYNDHADRDFTISITSSGVKGTEIKVSNTDDLEIGDVITQTQDVTISYLNNRILSRMDTFDKGLNFGNVSGTIHAENPVRIETPYNHNIPTGSILNISIKYEEDSVIKTLINSFIVTVIDNLNFTIDFDNSLGNIQSIEFKDYFLKVYGATPGSNMRDKLQALNNYFESIDPYLSTSVFTNKTFTFANLTQQMNLLIDELNNVSAPTLLKDYKKPETITYETYIVSLDLPNNIVFSKTDRPFLEQEIQIYKHINKVVEWNPQHFGDPSAVKQVREATIMFDQNNFNEAFAKFGSDVEQALTTVQFSGKGKGYWGDLPWGDPNHYWGGDGNDIPFRTLVPRGKQKCRYLTMVFEHNNAREYFRILGISGVVRVISSRGYR